VSGANGMPPVTAAIISSPKVVGVAKIWFLICITPLWPSRGKLFEFVRACTFRSNANRATEKIPVADRCASDELRESREIPKIAGRLSHFRAYRHRTAPSRLNTAL